MKKFIINAIVFVALISMFFTFLPNVSGQPENVEVLSYSWYILEGDFQDAVVVVGEVQNVGLNIIQRITLQGVVYTTDGEPQAVAYTVPYAENIQPQQKVPFQIFVFAQSSYTGDLSWVLLGIDHVAFYVVEADVTEDYQYQDLEVTSSSNYVDSDGYYTVSGTLKNTGDRTTGRPWIVATYYNATGDVIATGYSLYLDVLAPEETTTFTVTPTDAPIELTDQITDYTLLIQTEAPIFPNGPFEPSSPPSSEAPTTASPSSEAPTDTQNGGSTDLTPILIAVPVVLAAIFIVAILYRRKKPNNT